MSPVSQAWHCTTPQRGSLTPALPLLKVLPTPHDLGAQSRPRRIGLRQAPGWRRSTTDDKGTGGAARPGRWRLQLLPGGQHTRDPAARTLQQLRQLGQFRPGKTLDLFCAQQLFDALGPGQGPAVAFGNLLDKPQQAAVQMKDGVLAMIGNPGSRADLRRSGSLL